MTNVITSHVHVSTKLLQLQSQMSTPSICAYEILLNNEPLMVLLDFSLTVKAATLIFISGCGSAISSAKEGKSGFIYNLVQSQYAF